MFKCSFAIGILLAAASSSVFAETGVTFKNNSDADLECFYDDEKGKADAQFLKLASKEERHFDQYSLGSKVSCAMALEPPIEHATTELTHFSVKLNGTYEATSASDYYESRERDLVSISS